MAVVFSNNAKTVLASSVSTSATSISVVDGSVFPALSGSNYTYVTFEDVPGNVEIVKVTARSGNTLTVVRAQDNTSARAFAAGDKCELRLTAAGLNEVATQADTDTTYTVGDGGLTQNNFTNADHTKLNAINQGVATGDSPTFSALTSTGEITANGGIALGDNDKATFGTSDDLVVYHDGSNSFITDVGTGNLKIGGANVEITTAGGTKYLEGGANVLRLYHTGNEKLRTSAAGIFVTGGMTAGTLTAGAGSITDTSGAISFGNENLSTTGTLASGDLNVTGNITVNGTVDDRDVATDGTKLDGIETGATADQTAAQLLAAIKTVDVNGFSGVNAGRLDGHALTIASTGSTVVERDSSGDINARLFRSEYDSTNSNIGYVMTQVDTVSNNYIRPSTLAQLRASLNVENGATADQTAAQILTAVKTVDGSGSGLDADTVDGIQGASFLRSDATDTASGAVTFSAATIYMAGNLAHSGDTNTYMGFHAADQWRVVTGGAERLEVNNTAVTVAGNMKVNGTLTVRTAIDLADNDILRFGSGDDTEFFCNGSHMYMDLNAGIGNFYIRDTTTTRFTFDDAGHFTATGNITAYSDIRLKEDIKPIEDAVSKVQQLTGNTYTRNDLKDPDRRYGGVIAQEVEVVLPEAVNDSEDGTKTVDYNAMIALLVESVKELKAEIEDLKTQIGD